MQPQPINSLIFKGTHNSYECTGIWPCMNHPLDVQIDSFGVWAVELDIGINEFDPFRVPPTVLVGENQSGDKACFVPGPCKLDDYFRQIQNSLSIQYRPIFVYFDIKDWTASYHGNEGFDGIAAAADWGVQVAAQVFGYERVIVLSDYVAQNGYPVLPDNSVFQPGTVIIYYPSPEYGPGPDGRAPAGGTLPGVTLGGCVNAATVEGAVQNGRRVILLDLYQADWTFEYGVPPNPIVVDLDAKPVQRVEDSIGDEWWCPLLYDLLEDPRPTEVSKGQLVAEHGTYRFPYRTVNAAVDRAKAKGQGFDPRRAGYGWTVLIKPGDYPETVIIDIPLRLERDGRYANAGAVVIGG